MLVQHYKILDYLSVLLYTDCFSISKISKLDVLDPTFRNIRCQTDSRRQVEEAASTFIMFFKEGAAKMSSSSKGEIPRIIHNEVFSLLWKNHPTFLTRNYFMDIPARKEGASKAKQLFFSFLELVYKGSLEAICKLMPDNNNEKIKLKSNLTATYSKLRSLEELALETDQVKALERARKFLEQNDFIYKITVNAFLCSECWEGKGVACESLQKDMDSWILKNLI